MLADDAFVQAFFHLQKAFRFGFQHLRDRDARPLGYHLGDIVLVDDLVQLVVALPLFALRVELLFHAHAFGFLLGSTLVIPLQTGLFFLSQ